HPAGKSSRKPAIVTTSAQRGPARRYWAAIRPWRDRITAGVTLGIARWPHLPGILPLLRGGEPKRFSSLQGFPTPSFPPTRLAGGHGGDASPPARHWLRMLRSKA